MSMKSKGRIIAILCVLLILVAGCSGKKSDASDELSQAVDAEEEKTEGATVTLTERQKKILADEELPINYDQLTDSQKNAIVKIEDALSYLEETYHDEFEYAGYVAGGIDGQYVEAKIVDSLPEKYVTVDITYKDGEYHYYDNYEALMAEDDYVEEVRAFLDNYFDPAEYQVYMEITELAEEGDSIVERAMGCPEIFINDVYSEEEVEAVVKAYSSWVADVRRDGGGADFLIFTSEVFPLINVFNYKDYIGKERLMFSLAVREDRSVDIERYE